MVFFYNEFMRIVIFGCGIIANRIAKSCLLVKEIELLGFASKDVAKAKEYALKYGCKDYGDYDHFLYSSCDAIYIATHNPSHYELIKKCLLHHKHVICEKPMLSSLQENEEMFKLAKENKVVLMEAMKAVFLPINIKTKQLLKEDRLGKIERIETSFLRGSNFERNHWIYDPKTGGALKDLGSYCVGIMNFLTDEEPVLIERKTNKDDEHADTSAEATIGYGDVIGHLKVSNSSEGYSGLKVYGEKGYLEIEDFWKTDHGYYVADGIRYELKEELISDFYYELKHFAYLVDHGLLESDVMDKAASDKILKVTA